MTVEEIEDLMLKFINDELRIDTEDLDRDTELVSTGQIDSTDLVRFSAFLERSFNIEIPDQDVNAEHFDSIAMSSAYVLGRLNG